MVMKQPADIEDRPHDEAELLLPWYATGRLDLLERRMVERHLESCSHCSHAQKVEYRLMEQIEELAPEVDMSWARLRARLTTTDSLLDKAARFAAAFWSGLSGPAAAVLVTAQLAIIMVTAGLTMWLDMPRYHALGSAPPAHGGNLILMFNSAATEGDITKALKASGATLVAGPTPADAYLAYVPSDRRQAALAELRSNQDVELAEPIDEPSP